MFRTRRSALASGADCVVDIRFADRAGDKLRYRLQLRALSLPRQYPSRTASQDLFPNDREQLICGSARPLRAGIPFLYGRLVGIEVAREDRLANGIVFAQRLDLAWGQLLPDETGRPHRRSASSPCR